MTHNDFQYGTITLPSGQAPKLRKAMREAVDAAVARYRPMCDKVWAEVKKTPAAKRDYRVIDAAFEKVYPFPDTRLGMPDDAVRIRWNHDQDAVVASMRATRTTYGAPSTRRIQEHLTRRSENTDGTFTTIWRVGNEAVASLHGNRLTWDVAEGNHAVEWTGAHPLYPALFGFLDTVKWTARSGGTIWGNDEYNQDSGRESGGYDGAGADYRVKVYESEAASKRRMKNGMRGAF